MSAPVCFASYNETLPRDAAPILLGLADYLCLLDEGHAGDHEWTPQRDIIIKQE